MSYDLQSSQPSKRIKTVLNILLGMLLVIFILISFQRYWVSSSDRTTQSLPVTYPPPKGGFSCLPTCSEIDGKLLVAPGKEMASFLPNTLVVWISVPVDYSQFDLAIFDGDSGKDLNSDLLMDRRGYYDFLSGNWDTSMTGDTTFALFADPLKDGKGKTLLGTWMGNQDGMPNNDWYPISLTNVPEARGPSGHYFYRLEISRPPDELGANGFKLRSNAYLSTGKSALVDASLSLVGMMATWGDAGILYPSYESRQNPGISTYSGRWQFFIVIPDEMPSFEIWDGDFDHGTSPLQGDRDDPNTIGKPAWAGQAISAERAAGQGNLADDAQMALYARSPAVEYWITPPGYTSVYINNNPSGANEWERVVWSTDPAEENADRKIDQISAGFYNLQLVGLDLANTVWLRTDFEILPVCETGPCVPPPVWIEGACPQPTGHWKQLLAGLAAPTAGKEDLETSESLAQALRTVALASPLFRSGINVAAPIHLDSASPLTFAEANLLLQRDTLDPSAYPGDPDSWLARALQHNLAAWLNLSVGNIGPTNRVEISLEDGDFSGTVWAALQESQEIILSGGDLSRAYWIAKTINNSELGENVSASKCRVYEKIFPAGSQPPNFETMARAATRPEPLPPTPVKEANVFTCKPRVNTYQWESHAGLPSQFRFTFEFGVELKNGASDIFRIYLPTEQVTTLTALLVKATAGDLIGAAVIEGCAFTNTLVCGEAVSDPDNNFAFSYLGVSDFEADGMALNLQVVNFTDQPLDQVLVELPDGVTPTMPSETYQSRVCP